MDIVEQLRDAWKTSSQNSLLISQAADEIERLRKERDELLALLERYRNETPVGHQPHMICHVVDDALAKIREVK